jgi:hypothetical protein
MGDRQGLSEQSRASHKKRGFCIPYPCYLNVFTYYIEMFFKNNFIYYIDAGG